MTVGEQGVTARPVSRGATRVAGVRSLFPLGAVVAPWLLSRVISVTVLLMAMDAPQLGSRFTQLAIKWDGSYYMVIARHGYGPVDVVFPRWPFFPGLPALIRVLGELGRVDEQV